MDGEFNLLARSMAGTMIKVFEAMAQDGVIRLPADVPSSAHCVVTILENGLEGLREQSRLELPADVQERMSELLVKNREAALTPAESAELDALAEQFEAATLVKGRALAVLAQLGDQARAG